MGGRLEKKHTKWTIRKRVLPPLRECPNCKKKFEKGDSGHFVPPSFGQKGFFYCEKNA